MTEGPNLTGVKSQKIRIKMQFLTLNHSFPTDCKNRLNSVNVKSETVDVGLDSETLCG
jgi:hypothetical protein